LRYWWNIEKSNFNFFFKYRDGISKSKAGYDQLRESLPFDAFWHSIIEIPCRNLQYQWHSLSKLIPLFGNSSGPVNSIENTACLIIFEADETPENIRKACGRVINEIVQWGKMG
jgi:hypothetical protein